MKGKRFLGMFSVALALTVITVVIFDLRNPMMNFLMNNVARTYIVALGICAIAEGVVLIRSSLRKKKKSSRQASASDSRE